MYCLPLVVGSICRVVGYHETLFVIVSKGYISGDSTLFFTLRPLNHLYTEVFPLSDIRRVVIYD